MTESFNSETGEEAESYKISSEQIARIRQGDQNAWSEVFSSVNPVLIKIAIDMFGSNSADDVVLMTWEKIFRKFSNDSNFDPKNLYAYLVRILLNTGKSINRLEYTKREIPTDMSDPSNKNSGDIDPGEIIPRIEAVKQILDFAEGTKAGAGEIFRGYMRGDSLEQIAIQLQVSPGTIKSTTSRSRERLRSDSVILKNISDLTDSSVNESISRKVLPSRKKR
jgi:RNA polymerase sigma factor (sigma-70 family)